MAAAHGPPSGWTTSRRSKQRARVTVAAPYSQTSAQVLAGGTNWYTVIGGTTPAWLAVGNWSIAQGAFFTKEDVLRVTKVAVLGNTVAANLFPPAGQSEARSSSRAYPFACWESWFQGADGFRPGPG